MRHKAEKKECPAEIRHIVIEPSQIVTETGEIHPISYETLKELLEDISNAPIIIELLGRYLKYCCKTAPTEADNPKFVSAYMKKCDYYDTHKIQILHMTYLTAENQPVFLILRGHTSYKYGQSYTMYSKGDKFGINDEIWFGNRDYDKLTGEELTILRIFSPFDIVKLFTRTANTTTRVLCHI